MSPTQNPALTTIAVPPGLLTCAVSPTRHMFLILSAHSLHAASYLRHNADAGSLHKFTPQTPSACLDTAHVPTPIHSAGSIVSPTRHMFHHDSLHHTYCTALRSDPTSSACRRYTRTAAEMIWRSDRAPSAFRRYADEEKPRRGFNYGKRRV